MFFISLPRLTVQSYKIFKELPNIQASKNPLKFLGIKFMGLWVATPLCHPGVSCLVFIGQRIIERFQILPD